jgi:cytoskeletal protein CcmA (bactofilin family)
MTNIGSTLTITGDMTSQEDVTVHGTVNGTITMKQGTLVVARQGTTAATVKGSRIAVHGTVSGDLVATDQIEMSETAKVNATVTVPSLVLREGAVLNGTVDVWPNDDATKTARPKPAVAEPTAKAS